MQATFESPNFDLPAELARMGLSQPYVSQLVNRRRSPSLKLALRIERELGVPPKFWADHDAPPVDEVGNMAPADGCGAENPERNVSRTDEPGLSPEGAAA